MAHTLGNNKSILNKLSLSLIALCFSYGIWNTLSTAHKIKISLPAAISVYNTDNRMFHCLPEEITLTLYGPRNALRYYAYHAAIHIDAALYENGTHLIKLKKNMVYVPEDTILVDYSSHTITITLETRS